ncbi:MAG: AI-2E family transporter [Pseudomonadota bacterium]|nr:MAG: AI-2E family transporter [Pseudomonadota bacterium]
MTTSDQTLGEQLFVRNALEATIRIGVVLLLATWCLQIVFPFIVPVLWGIIIATAVYPIYLRMQHALGERRGLAAALFTLLTLALLIVPSVMLVGSMVESAQAIADGLREGSLAIPPPPDGVATWPFIGEKLHSAWALASTNLEAALAEMRPQVKAVGNWLLSTAANAGSGMVQSIFALIIAGVFLAKAEVSHQLARTIAVRLSGQAGEEFADLARATVRSVAQGVVGIAVIQSLLAGIGLLAIGMPAAGLWALLVLILAVVQLPPFLVLGPIIVYVFSYADTLPAIIFTVWSLFVSVSDGILKPMLLGRGVSVPMLVILIGAIGGMLLYGIIGLFVGAVVLALGYKLFMAWLHQDVETALQQGSADASPAS